MKRARLHVISHTHWGIYAIPGWQEQHQLRLKTPRAEYAKLAAQFNPTAFDPDAWIDLAESARILRMIGAWHLRIRESLTDVETVDNIATEPAVPVTRRGDTIYLHLHRPLNVRRLLVTGVKTPPERAVLLNDSRAIRCSTERLPWRHKTGERPLRLCDLPVNEHAGSVMVIRLDFAPGILPPEPPERLGATQPLIRPNSLSIAPRQAK